MFIKMIKITKWFSIVACVTLTLNATAWAQNFAGTITPEIKADQYYRETEDPLMGDIYDDDLMNNNLEDIGPLDQVKAPSQLTATDEKKMLEDTMATMLDSALDPSKMLDHYPDESKYTLGRTDVVSITVLRHPEVSGNFFINNEGKIQYEFVGDVYVEGMTKNELKDIIIERLADFIISPEVLIKIVGYNSKIVYVVGEVGHPGKIYMKGDTITVREALVQAGLPLLSAKTTRSQLITPSDNGKPSKQRVNIHKLLYEGDLRQNFVMKPGDTLYLPPTLMTKVMRTMQPVAQPLGTASSMGRTMQTGF
ncbi:MAG: polysaccharide export protein [Candidatus Omnitrophica bacterium]|nr:polysaccharide export protein [Candidatus Omnitrophota bacterium]